LLQADRLGFAELGREVLRQLGAGFLTPFDRKHFEHLIGGPYASMQSKVLDVLERLSQEFGDRISSVVWDSFAFLGTVPDPTIETTILRDCKKKVAKPIKERRRRVKKAQEWRRRDERPESVSLGFDRCGVGNLGALHSRGLTQRDDPHHFATRNRERDTLRLA
jgi:hypothetical protein